jgi:deoxyribodipyrimidine photo-lyase
MDKYAGKKYENGLFIFRRDLRIVDNNGLNSLANICKNIFAVFIFTPEQVGSANKYKSPNAVQFMIESLRDLDSEINSQHGKLHFFYGKNNRVVADCIKALDINVVAFNLDVTPYAKERDTDISKICERSGVDVFTTHDYFLHDPGTIKNGSGGPYQKFTPYYETASRSRVNNPANKKQLPFSQSSRMIGNQIVLDDAAHKFVPRQNQHILVHGGRREALRLLAESAKRIHSYDAIHNDLNKETSKLSAAIKFGCVSIREVYKAFHSKPGFIRQLYWRDFYANIMHEFPRVIGHSLKPSYDKIRWHHNNSLFKKWCNGETGFPIVDAGMRQMNATGYMHNRTRLIVASFLIKTLLIDWREGERYFATKLTDYDPANNNGNWQWVSGGGADSQPYFRVFNPWRQAEEYDRDAEYIKKWVPELRDVPSKDIMKWNTKYGNYKEVAYPPPIVKYEERRDEVIKMYSAAFH